MATEPQLLTDVRLDLDRAQLRPVYRVAAHRRAVSTAQGLRSVVDLEVVSGRENLGQAIVMRLLTPRGELAELGHPEYGSRLHELLGSPNTEARRRLAKLFVLDALARDPRVEEVVDVTVEPHRDQRDRVDIAIAVRPLGSVETLVVGPFAFSFTP